MDDLDARGKEVARILAGLRPPRDKSAKVSGSGPNRTRVSSRPRDLRSSDYDKQRKYEDDAGADKPKGKVDKYGNDVDEDGDTEMQDAVRPAVAETSDLDQATLGVELEFLCVQCPRLRDPRFSNPGDPHENDGRYSSLKMSKWEENTPEFDRDGPVYNQRNHRYTRVKMCRVLRDAGLTVVKMVDGNFDARVTDEYGTLRFPATPRVPDFSDSEPSDDEREEEHSNATVLSNFSSTHRDYAGQNLTDSFNLALDQFIIDFINFHTRNGIKLYRTKKIQIQEAANRLFCQYPVHVSPAMLSSTREEFDDNVPDWEWDPFGAYRWFGAEVISPVLPQNSAVTREAIRRATLKISTKSSTFFDPTGNTMNAESTDRWSSDKPMEVTSGLHVHLGHSKGWTLDQLKRFACFWYLAEDTIYHLHRRDRGEDDTWCARMRNASNLWQALCLLLPAGLQVVPGTVQQHSPLQLWLMHSRFSDDFDIRDDLESTVEYHPDNITSQYEALMEANVPADSEDLEDDESYFLRALYRCSSITNLAYALNANDDQQADPESQTIEARIMAGTLDADHINNWIAVLEHIVTIARDWSNARFRQMLERFLPDRSMENLLREIGVSDYIRDYWLDPKRRDATNTWWEYPDRDRVDWGNPFNVRGHRATHGSEWD
ncbi:hypothetical protein GGR57DRAFT_512759 [Xylariaceae sp. FL1272]|nr:hypothetical protein GGR57DRAFT_512759 [Xylariaceae sp. FL1272]